MNPTIDTINNKLRNTIKKPDNTGLPIPLTVLNKSAIGKNIMFANNIVAIATGIVYMTPKLFDNVGMKIVTNTPKVTAENMAIIHALFGDKRFVLVSQSVNTVLYPNALRARLIETNKNNVVVPYPIS